MSDDEKKLSQRPTTPRARPAAPVSADTSGDDDAVIVPAPSIDVFLPKQRGTRAAAKRAASSSLAMRRTLIPILLTNGVLLPALGAMWFATDVDSPFRRTGAWLPIMLIAVGVLLLVFGVLNALFVRHELAASRN